MGIGPFAYVPFILVFLKFNDASYDMRQQVHKTMGVVSYLFILVNILTGSGMVILDVALFAFASYYFYAAMTEQFERDSTPALIVMAVFAVLSVGLYWKLAPAPAKPGTKTEDAKQVEEALKKALGAATKAMQQRQNPDPQAP